jgi:hypothetical protein
MDVHTKLPHMETVWIQSLRTYLVAIHGQIEVQNPGVPSILRENDQYIMDIAIQSGKFKPNHLRPLNYCRLYLNVTTIAEITNATGTAIDQAMFNGSRDATQSKAQWQQVLQNKPNKTSWTIWKKTLQNYK